MLDEVQSQIDYCSLLCSAFKGYYILQNNLNWTDLQVHNSESE